MVKNSNLRDFDAFTAITTSPAPPSVGAARNAPFPSSAASSKSEEQGRNSYAIAALSMGVLALVLALPLGFVAIYFFLRAHQDRQKGQCSRKMYRAAVIGLVLGVIGALGTLFAVWFIANAGTGPRGGFINAPSPFFSF